MADAKILRGEVVTRQGEEAHRLYILHSGEVDVLRTLQLDHREQVCSFCSRALLSVCGRCSFGVWGVVLVVCVCVGAGGVVLCRCVCVCVCDLLIFVI